MKEFINQKYQLAKIEKDIAEIRILEKQKHDEIESWGKKVFYEISKRKYHRSYKGG